MSEIRIPLSSGGGVDLDVITAGADDVLAPKVIVGSDGEPLTGTLALSGNANTVDVRKGKTFYSNNAKSKLTGAMAEKGAQTYTPGKTNQVIAANQFLTGAQTILGDADLIPDNIVYGKSIFNVQGKARKYARFEKVVKTSGYKNFVIWNRNNISVNLPYLEIPTGFTPLSGFFRCGSGSDPAFTLNTAFEEYQYCISYNGRNGLISKSGSGAEASSAKMIVPVMNSGDYICLISGYY